VPERGLAYGLLRDLAPDPAVRARLEQAPQAEVLWNYLGQLRRDDAADRPFGVVTRAAGLDRSPRAPRTHLLEINALIDGDALQVAFAYSTARHRRETIETLADDLIASVQDLIGDADDRRAATYAPSDFPDAELSAHDLALLVAELEEARTP
jgi:non-ribosomal peptide synthase protein (TIGR01720 family)